MYELSMSYIHLFRTSYGYFDPTQIQKPFHESKYSGTASNWAQVWIIKKLIYLGKKETIKTLGFIAGNFCHTGITLEITFSDVLKKTPQWSAAWLMTVI